MSADIQSIASELGLKKAGKQNGEIRYYDPYDKDTPDLYVDTQNERWYTFANGQNKGGGYIDLVQHVKNCDETEAQEWMAENFETDDNDSERFRKKADARNVLETATEIAHRQLQQRQTQLLKDIKERRTFDQDIINQARIGFINDTVVETLTGRFDKETLINSGLFNESDGDLYCVLNNRIVYPYIAADKTVFMAGRKTQDHQEAKYKKTRTTEYNRHILYQFRDNRNTLIITEGFTDALSAYKAGYDVVSPATTTFKDDDISKMRRVAEKYDHVYIVNDADEAGREGAKQTAIRMIQNGINPHFVELEDGMDLDDWTNENGYDLTPLLDSSESYIDYLVRNIVKTGDAANQVDAKNKLYDAVSEWPQSQRRQIWKRLNDPIPVLEHELRQRQKKKKRNRDYSYSDYTVPRQDGDGRKFSPKKMADDIMQDYDFAQIRDSEQFLVYQDGYWQRTAESVVKEEVPKRLNHEYRGNRKSNVKDVIKGYSQVSRNNFQTVDDKVNVKNGVVDLRTGNLLPHSPAYNFQFKIPWRYEPDADCPKIDSFLDDVTNGDEEKKKKLYQLFGYILIPDLIDEKAGVLIGSGSNGKTIVIELMKELLGKMGNAYGNKSLQNIEGSRFSTNFLFGKVANFDDDMPSTKLKRTGLFKKLTGGTDQGAEIKRGSQYNFKPYASMIFAANYLPKTEDESNGFYRRWYMIHLPVDFVDNPDPDDPLQKQKKQKDELLDELTQPSEMRGLLTKTINEAIELKREGTFKHDRGWKEKRNLWKRHSEPVTSFIKRFITQGTTKSEADTRQDDSETLTGHTYDYIRKDCLHDMVRAYTQMISGETVSKQDLKKALDESTLHLGFGVQPRVENRKRVISGIKIELPKKDKGIREGIPPFLYQLNSNKYAESSQSIFIVDPDDTNIKDAITNTITELDGGSGVSYTELINKLNDDFDEKQIKQELETLQEKGTLYEPKPGRVKKL